MTSKNTSTQISNRQPEGQAQATDAQTNQVSGAGGPPPREQVIGWLIEGHRNADILQAVAAKWPGADPAALLDSAVDHFRAAGQADAGTVTGWALEAYRDLYRRSLKIGDFGTAMKAVDKLSAMVGKLQSAPAPEAEKPLLPAIAETPGLKALKAAEQADEDEAAIDEFISQYEGDHGAA